MKQNSSKNKPYFQREIRSIIYRNTNNNFVYCASQKYFYFFILYHRTFVLMKCFINCCRYQNGLFWEQRQVEQGRYGLPQVAHAIR